MLTKKGPYALKGMQRAGGSLLQDDFASQSMSEAARGAGGSEIADRKAKTV